MLRISAIRTFDRIAGIWPKDVWPKEHWLKRHLTERTFEVRPKTEYLSMLQHIFTNFKRLTFSLHYHYNDILNGFLWFRMNMKLLFKCYWCSNIHLTQYGKFRRYPDVPIYLFLPYIHDFRASTCLWIEPKVTFLRSADKNKIRGRE